MARYQAVRTQVLSKRATAQCQSCQRLQLRSAPCTTGAEGLSLVSQSSALASTALPPSCSRDCITAHTH